MNTISFKKIKKLFPKKTWDVGVISAEDLKQCSNFPIKVHFHHTGRDYVTGTGIHFGRFTNCIVLVCKGDTWDYSFYKEAARILKDNNITRAFPVYTNFKEAAILAGVGVRARNSLIYTYKFGFDAHICAFGFMDEIIDIPTNKRKNFKMWRRCKGCDDCAKACPAGAIHNESEPYWMDSTACENFIHYSDHPNVPSVKKFWRLHVYPEISEEQARKIKSPADIPGGMNFDRNGYRWDGNTTYKDGVPITVPVCRECTSQPRCSKWGGKYPYDKIK